MSQGNENLQHRRHRTVRLHARLPRWRLSPRRFSENSRVDRAGEESAEIYSHDLVLLNLLASGHGSH